MSGCSSYESASLSMEIPFDFILVHRVYLLTKFQGRRVKGSALRGQTDGETDGCTDRLMDR